MAQPLIKEDRLSIRANAAQKDVLAQAAGLRHMNVSQFVLQSSLRAAEEIVRDESTLRVSAEEYSALARVMDEITPTPSLRRALAQAPVWEASFER